MKIPVEGVQRIEIDIQQLKGIVEQARKAPLDEASCQMLHRVIETIVFLTELIEKKDTTIRDLRQLLSPLSTEKTKKALENAGIEPSQEPGPSAQPAVPGAETATAKPEAEVPKQKRKGHGKNGASAYKGAPKVEIAHTSLKPGDPCPKCEKGKLYAAPQGVLVRVVGQAPLHATVYHIDKLRCNLCQAIFAPEIPKDIGPKKYSETAISMIALLKYSAGFPFYRLGVLQENLQIPLPPATQWDLLAPTAESLKPAWGELIREAAQGEVLYDDDTKMKILSLMKEIALAKRNGASPERTGLFTTGIVAKTREGEHIALFFTGPKHAGENLAEVLSRRDAELSPPILMCDALTRNLPKNLQVILGNCNAHARRRYVSVTPNFPEECRYVLETLGAVYHNDAVTHEQNMTAEQRLHFHKTHSGPLMDELHEWLKTRLGEKKVEPNSGLGEAIRYMLNHWIPLTLFLRQVDAPLDNSIVERALKKVILLRKNSLFYKTQAGARVGDLFMSLIYTCELCGANPFHYLTELQRHTWELSEHPEDWLPWNYRDTMARTGLLLAS
jgi:transposase